MPIFLCFKKSLVRNIWYKALHTLTPPVDSKNKISNIVQRTNRVKSVWSVNLLLSTSLGHMLDSRNLVGLPMERLQLHDMQLIRRDAITCTTRTLAKLHTFCTAGVFVRLIHETGASVSPSVINDTRKVYQHRVKTIFKIKCHVSAAINSKNVNKEGSRRYINHARRGNPRCRWTSILTLLSQNLKSKRGFTRGAMKLTPWVITGQLIKLFAAAIFADFERVNLLFFCLWIRIILPFTCCCCILYLCAVSQRVNTSN